MASRQVHACDACGAELTNGYQPRAGIFINGNIDISSQTRRSPPSQYTDSGHRRTFGNDHGAKEFCSVNCLRAAFEDILRSYEGFALDNEPVPVPQPTPQPPSGWTPPKPEVIHPFNPPRTHAPPPFAPPFVHIEQDVPTTGNPPMAPSTSFITTVDPNIPFTNTTASDAEVCHSPDTEPREVVTVHLNGVSHTFLTSILTGADIRGLEPEYNAGYTLYHEHTDGTPDTVVTDDDQFVLHANVRHDFYSVPPATFGTSEPPTDEPLNTPDEPPTNEVPF